MPRGTLRLNPKTHKVQFAGSGGIRLPDMRLEELPSEIRAALNKPPYQVAVEAQGFPPRFQLVAAADSQPSASTRQPVTPQKGQFAITANQPEVCLNPVPERRTTTFQVTDPGLGFSVGNELSEPERGLHPGLMLVRFSPQIPVVGGQSPDVDRNPYNFVAFAADEPWLVNSPHPDHSHWQAGCFSGILEFEASTLTPLFIPEGFPFKADTDEEIRRHLTIPRHFFRLSDSRGKVHYAIPGSSLKGVLRSAVEALSNSRCGELNEDFYSRPIPYRRRVFDDVGVLAKDSAGHWCVEKVEIYCVNPRDWSNKFATPSQNQMLPYAIRNDGFKKFAIPGADRTATAHDVLPYRANLLYARTKNHRYSHVITHRLGQRFALGPDVLAIYEKNLAHPHYERHRIKHGKDSERYFQPLHERLDLQEGDLVYFTLDSGKRIDSFGKNVNYVWPSKVSVQKLAEPFFPQQDLSLEQPLGLAERMFGFSGRHKKNQNGEVVSHPFRGKIRIEACWGPEAVPHAGEKASDLHVLLRLAPLTAPQTRAKSRPLYLTGKADGSSATYDDPNPQLKGRKFYWHQNADSGGNIWPKHAYDSTLHSGVDGQCPPPFFALRAGLAFNGRIHFDNLTKAELGCLVYALEGAGGDGYALKIGKGKPRGLGSLSARITSLRGFDPRSYYVSLDSAPESQLSKREFLDAFQKWLGEGTRNSDHLRDFDNLHRFPKQTSIRYYPVNFSDYGWLPKANGNPDRPNAGRYPRAMRRSRDLES